VTTLFISDLHLCDERPRGNEIFVEFLRSDASGAAALYILGDLLEYWIGDDTLDRHPPVFMAAMRALSDSGVPVFVMHGNRDFLLGTRFAAACGCTLIADPTLITLGETRTLLMHGDTLCTDDVAYQTFRRQVRDPRWQQQFLALPWEQRVSTAKSVRAESQLQTAAKADYITDVNADAVRLAMRAAGVSQLIHGHTHRQAIHSFDLDGAAARRIVLGDWYEHGSVLKYDDTDGFRFVTL
jgi:UDP-2,3-diacylglucosamine hydrolase